MTGQPNGPWQAVMANADGFVMDDEEIELWQNDPDKADRVTAGPPTQLVIVRGSALPKPQTEDPDEEFYRLPGHWLVSDRFLELDVDREFNDVEDLVVLWRRAQAAVAGMNAAGVQ